MNNEKRKTFMMDQDDFTPASAAGDHEREKSDIKSLYPGFTEKA